ncbi:MAG: sulfur carrier protein ThiS adenylyltransferase ThiF [Clostridia bacterium]|nr:sulfur carrier protein ThiS adenylyltransferase ThiF [Clostridia bacterium]
MNAFEKALRGYMSEENLKKIQKVKIGLAGAGGLGSNCACNLVRSGFKKLKVIDFDRVEATNLNRQFYFLDQVGLPKVEALRENLQKINPDLEIESIQVKIDESNMGSIFEDCDIVVEAFDKVIYKTMMVERYFSSGKLLVAVSGLAGWGNSDDIAVKKVHSKFYLIGDLMSEVDENKPPISPRVNIAAAKQADVILDYVIRND